jgi:hypothetical protein
VGEEGKAVKVVTQTVQALSFAHCIATTQARSLVIRREAPLLALFALVPPPCRIFPAVRHFSDPDEPEKLR